VQHCHIFTSGSKFVTIMFLHPNHLNFLKDATISAICVHRKQFKVINICINFQDLFVQNEGFGEQNKARGCAMLIPTNSFLLMGIFTLIVPANIDQEMQP